MHFNSATIDATIFKHPDSSMVNAAKIVIEMLLAKLSKELCDSFDKTQEKVLNASEKKSLGDLDPFRKAIENLDLRAALEDFTPFVEARFLGKIRKLLAEYGEPVLNEHYFFTTTAMVGADPEAFATVQIHFAILRVYDERFGEMIGTLDLTLDTESYPMAARALDPSKSEEKAAKRGHLSLIK